VAGGKGQGNLSRSFKNLPTSALVEFSLGWRDTSGPGLLVTLGTERANDRRGMLSMSLLFQNRTVQVTMNSAQGGSSSATSLSEDRLGARKGRVRLIMDRKAGRAQVFLDGNSICQAGGFQAQADPDGAKPEDSSWKLTFQTVANWQSTVLARISRIRVGDAADDAPTLAPLQEAQDPAGDLLCLPNGDRLSGTIRAIQEGRLRMQAVCGAIDAPLGKARGIVFQAPVEATQVRSGGLRLRIGEEGTLCLVGAVVEKGMIRGRHPVCGEIELPLAKCREIEFEESRP
jgi:hypothetical protein